MLRFSRPPEPPSFARAVHTAHRDVLAAIAAGQSPIIPERWREFKDHFARAQHNKCGYCEVLLSATTGALDHYRPKAGLDELPADPRHHGREVPITSKVEDRRLQRLTESGYAWVAYAWDNYILSCERCNTGWKRCLFPVAEQPRTIPPRADAVETPLLLCPYERENPADHLLFDETGQVTARDGSARGQATIDTCGLGRPSLAAQRYEKARIAYALIRRFLRAADGDIESELWADIQSAGAPDKPHAGMVRAIFEEQTGEPWASVFDGP